LGDSAGAGALENFLTGPNLEDVAIVEDSDTVREEVSLTEVVGDEEDSEAEFGAQTEELLAHRSAKRVVEGAEGLIEEEQRSFAGNGSGERDALTLSAGEGARAALFEPCEIEEFEEFGDSGGPVGRPRKTERDVIRDAEVFKEREFLDDVANAPCLGREVPLRGGIEEDLAIE
jgi:hypothetical protein